MTLHYKETKNWLNPMGGSDLEMNINIKLLNTMSYPLLRSIRKEI